MNGEGFAFAAWVRQVKRNGYAISNMNFLREIWSERNQWKSSKRIFDNLCTPYDERSW